MRRRNLLEYRRFSDPYDGSVYFRKKGGGQNASDNAIRVGANRVSRQNTHGTERQKSDQNQQD